MKSVKSAGATRRAAVAPADPDTGESTTYAVPALEKGLDVVEFLSAQERPLTLTGIAQALDRSPGELFRIVTVLARRGWIARLADDSYQLTAKLFELAHGYPPNKRLVDVALPVMRAISNDLGQSCHLSVADSGDQLVILAIESNGAAGVFVRTGTRYPLGTTASGRVMLAFGSEEVLAGAQEHSAVERITERPLPSDLPERLARIRARGFEEVVGEWLDAVVDICWPIFNARAEVTAVLAMPFLAIARRRVDVGAARQRAREGAEQISRALGAGDYEACLAAARGRKAAASGEDP
ncbi:IclR family transcriptional regulator [Prosthecomicrobium sp. N25]|uniref:IclR family transcriptional regulator n=1 Tax=Prosthecomicrobium sp. N25 TaxID=3129254 RepID=UPI003078A230